MSWGVLTDANLFSAHALMRVNRWLRPWDPDARLDYLNSFK